MNAVSAYPALTQAEKDVAEGRFDDASRLLIQHLRQHRSEPRGLALLGDVAMKQGALLQAERFMRQAMAAGLRSLDVQQNYAIVLNRQERLGEALEAFNLLEPYATDPQFLRLKGHILDKLGRNDEAIDHCEKLLAQDPEDTQVLIGYGNALRAAGRTDDAIAAYRRVVRIDPERGDAWWSLAAIKSKVLTDEDVAVMQAALKSAVDNANIVPLHFSVARALHDRQRFEEAFIHYAEGNRIHAERINYDAREITKEVNTFSRIFQEEHFSKQATFRHNGPIPVFLISMPRAGSTLLEQMLDCHPQIEGVGELLYIRAILRSAMEMYTNRGCSTVDELILTLSEADKETMGRDYLERTQLHRRKEARYFIDKMPTNWSDVLFIREILPHARFVEIRRNAMDCCFSNFVHCFSSSHAAATNLEDMGRAFVDYVRLMDHFDGVAPGWIHHVNYERLVDDPETHLRAVLDYLDLPWDQSVLGFHESARTVRTPSAEQVRRPLNRQGMGAWKPYESWLGPLMAAIEPLKRRHATLSEERV
jgi:tetratricopeptide (TPR) repeat protein